VALSFQDPLQDGTQDRDVVRLQSGGAVDGLIVEDSPNSITVEVGPGARIEIARSDVAEVRRAPRKAAESKPASAPARVNMTNDESWWILQNARGQFAGTRYFSKGRDPRNPLVIQWSEALELRDEDGRAVRVQRREFADANGRPLECNYAEVFDGGSSHVNAIVKGSLLEVECIDSSGRTSESLPLPAKAVFPLMYFDDVRTSAAGSGAAVTREVYDPFLRTFILKTARDGGVQPLSIGNETPVPCRVFVMNFRGVESRIWAGRNGEWLRYEVNGPDLVAVRATEDEARNAASGGSLSTWVARDATGKIKLLLPNAEWNVERVAAEGVTFGRKDGSVRAVASSFDLERDATTATAAHALDRRLKATLEKYKRADGFTPADVGRVPGTKFYFEFNENGKRRVGAAVAARANGQAFALVATFDEGDREKVDRDLDRILNRAEVSF
jgi:hypothetical protein